MTEARSPSGGTTKPEAHAERFVTSNPRVLRDELQRLGAELQAAGHPSGGLGLIGLFADVMTDEEIGEMVAAINAGRERLAPREIDTTNWGV